MTSLRLGSTNTTPRLLAAAAALLAACSVNESGNIPCVDDSNCPAAYPTCQGAGAGKTGVCVEGTGGSGGATTGSATIASVVGHQLTDTIAGDFHVQVTARTTNGVKSVVLKAGTATINFGSASVPPLYDFTVPAPTGTGALDLVATVTSGDDKAFASATVTVKFDNDVPVLTLADPVPQAARAGGLITVDVTTTEKLASIAGDVSFGGAKVGTLSVVSNTSDTAWKLGFAAPASAASGVYTFSITGTDLAGNVSAAKTKTTTLFGAFTLASTTVTGSGTIGGVAAGKSGSAITGTVKIPIAVPSPTATFALVDAANARRALATQTTTSDATNTTIKVTDAVKSTDADGPATLQVTVTDAAGNVTTGSASLVIDKTPPFLAGLAPSVTVADAQTGTPAGTVVLTGTASEPVATAGFAVAGTGGATGTCKCNGAACDGTVAAPVISCAVPVPSVTAQTTVNVAVQMTDVIGNASLDTANTASFQALPIPVLTTGAVSPATARPGSQVTVVVNSTQPLSSLTGTAVNGASSVSMALVSGALGAAGPYTMGFVVPTTGAVAGSYTMTLVGKGLAGGSSASVGASAIVALPFSVSSMTVSTGLTEPSGSGTLPAGATNAALTIVAKVPGGVPLDPSAAVFSITDSIGHSRTLTGSYSTGTDGSGNQVLTIADSIASGDAPGVAQVSVLVTDRGGNQGAGSASFIVDSVAPFLIGLAPNFTSADTARACLNGTCQANASGKITFTGKASEPITSATFAASGASTQTGTCTVDAASPPGVTCVVDVPGTGLVAAALVNLVVTVKDAVNNSSNGSSSSNQSSFQAVPLPTFTAFGTSATVTTGVATPITALFPTGNTGLVTNDQGAPSFPILGTGTAVNVTPALTTNYSLTVTNAVGSTISSPAGTPVTITVVSPGFTGAMTWVEPIITGGRATAMTINIPHLTGAASAILLDNAGNTAQKFSGGNVTSSDLITAGTPPGGGTLSLAPPSTTTSSNLVLSYTLIVLSGATPPVASSTSAVLTVLPVPTVSVTPNITLVTTGNQVQLTIKTTGAACTTAGLCQVINNKDANVIAVVGDTNATAGVTVAATVDQTKTYTAQVKNGATIATFVNSSPATAITAIPSPNVTLTSNLATVTLNNSVNLTVKTTNGACTVSGNCEIFNDKDATILPVVGDANAVSGVTVAALIDQAKTFTARVKNAAQDAVFVNSTGLPIATRPAPTATVSSTLTTVASGNQVAIKVNTTNADCVTAGNCVVKDNLGNTTAVTGDTNAVAGITVNITVTANRTFHAEVKANVADTVAVLSNNLAVTCVTNFLVAGFPSPSVSNVAGSVTVTARDASNATATGYRGTIHFTSNDANPGVVLPGDYAFQASDSGVHTFTNGVTLQTATSTASITATDTTSAGTTGSQTGITVNPGPASAATSVVTVVSPVASGSTTTVTLQAKDAAGNNLTAGGSTVVFSTQTLVSGTATVGATTDHANGTYTATVTGVLAGTVTLKATLNASNVTSTATLTVNPGTASVATSVVSVVSPVASGSTTTVTLQAKDAAGNNLTSGGSTVVFSTQTLVSGTATVGATTDHANGTYTATVTGVLAGTVTMKATLNASNVTSTATLTVNPGTASAATSVVTVVSPVASGSTTTVTLQAKDAAGNNLTAGGATVVFSTQTLASGTASVGTTTDNANGTYTATVTGVLAGTVTMKATLNASNVTSTAILTVNPGTASAATSVVTVVSPVASGSTTTVTLQAKDAAGNNLTAGGSTVVFSTQTLVSGTASVGTTTDNANGTYTATVTGVLAGTVTMKATLNASTVTSTATLTVNPGTASAATSVVSVVSPVASGSTTTVTLQAKDAAGNNLTAGGSTVVFSTQTLVNGTASVGSTTDNANGTYTATVTGILAGTVTMKATLNASNVTSTATLTVNPGTASAATSAVTVVSPVASGLTTTVTLQAKDAAGNNLTAGGSTVVFSTQTLVSGTASVGTTTDNANGTYTATVTGVLAGTVTMKATLNAANVTSTATLTVNPGGTTKFLVAGFPSPVTSGVTGSVTVTAQDTNGNTTPAYTGTIRITTPDVSATGFPVDYTFAGGDNGVKSFSGLALVTVNSSASIVVNENPASAVTGTQSPINVVAVPSFGGNPLSFVPNVMVNGNSTSGLLKFSLPLLSVGSASSVAMSVSGVKADDSSSVLAPTAVTKTGGGSFAPADLGNVSPISVDPPATSPSSNASRVYTYSLTATNAAGGASGTSAAVTATLNTYTLTSSMLSQRTGGTATFLPSTITKTGRDLVLIVGGCPKFFGSAGAIPGPSFSTDSNSATAELYDPKTGVVRALNPTGPPSASQSTTMFSGRCMHSSVLAANNKVYVFGGANTTKVEVYDPATEYFQLDSGLALPTIQSARFAQTATLIPSGANAGKIVVAGGYDATKSDGTRLATLELFDGSAGTVYSGTHVIAGRSSALSSPGRAEHSASLMGNFLYFVGGQQTDGSVDVLDVTALVGAGDQVRNLAAPVNATTRFGHAAAVISATKFLIAGGINSSNSLSSDAITRGLQLFTVDGTGGITSVSAAPSNCTGVPAGCLNTGRARSTLVAAAQANRMLLIGGTITLGTGSNDDVGTTAVESIDVSASPPVATTFATSLQQARTAPIGTNLQVPNASHFVLLVSGGRTVASTSQSAEIIISP